MAANRASEMPRMPRISRVVRRGEPLAEDADADADARRKDKTPAAVIPSQPVKHKEVKVAAQGDSARAKRVASVKPLHCARERWRREGVWAKAAAKCESSRETTPSRITRLNSAPWAETKAETEAGFARLPPDKSREQRRVRRAERMEDGPAR